MTRFRSEVLAWVAGCALLGCGGGAGNPVPDTRQKYEEFDCPPPGNIFREDCEKSALQYQGASFQGWVGVGGVGASAEYRQTAIREADALVQLLKEQRTSLCNNFNTCKLTVAEYREEQKRLDDSFVARMALKDKMAAMDAQGAALLLDEIRRIRTQAQEVKTASAGAQAAASGSSPTAAPPASAPPTVSPAPHRDTHGFSPDLRTVAGVDPGRPVSRTQERRLGQR